MSRRLELSSSEEMSDEESSSEESSPEESRYDVGYELELHEASADEDGNLTGPFKSSQKYTAELKEGSDPSL